MKSPLNGLAMPGQSIFRKVELKFIHFMMRTSQ